MMKTSCLIRSVLFPTALGLLLSLPVYNPETGVDRSRQMYPLTEDDLHPDAPVCFDGLNLQSRKSP